MPSAEFWLGQDAHLNSMRFSTDLQNAALHRSPTEMPTETSVNSIMDSKSMAAMPPCPGGKVLNYSDADECMSSHTAQNQLDRQGDTHQADTLSWAACPSCCSIPVLKKPKWVFPVTCLQLKVTAYSQPTL